jgi:hypothetical protein
MAKRELAAGLLSFILRERKRNGARTGHAGKRAIGVAYRVDKANGFCHMNTIT